jgi:hypothetical protein
MRVVHGEEMGFAAVTVVVACLYWVRALGYHATHDAPDLGVIDLHEADNGRSVAWFC